MPLNSQALRAAQAAMHCVPTRDDYSYAQAAVRLTDEASLENSAPRPRRMRLLDIPCVIRSVLDALDDSHDPVKHYLVDTPDFAKTRWSSFIIYVSNVIMYTLWVIMGVVWVVDDGSSFIVAELSIPRERRPPSSLVKWVSDMFQRFNGPFGYIFTQEQRNRNTEIFAVQDEKTRQVLGTRKEEMLVISTLATAPSAQRRGYASALVRMVTDEADRQGRATLLYSSNITANTMFYNSLGFRTVATYQVGEANPTWSEGVITVGVMVREPGKTVYPDSKIACVV